MSGYFEKNKQRVDVREAARVCTWERRKQQASKARPGQGRVKVGRSAATLFEAKQDTRDPNRWRCEKLCKAQIKESISTPGPKESWEERQSRGGQQFFLSLFTCLLKAALAG